jgi:hypothetical protein
VNHAPVALPSSEPILTGITNNWTRVRPSFFRGLAKSLEYAEDKCFGLILDSTVGHGRTWEKISWTRFCNVAAVTRRRVESAISALVGDGIIRSRPAQVGNGKEYAIAARADSDLTGLAKCRGCGQTDEVDLDLDFIPVPHSFFLSLPQSCDHGMYLVVKTVVERTMRWDRVNKQIVVIPCEILIEEFERATGKRRSEILEDLAKVQAAGYEFIGSAKVGRTNRYWARPEHFASAPARAAREVKQPKERKKSETVKPEKQVQVVEPTRGIRPVEFVTAPCGVCRHCGCYGPVDLVEGAAKKPIQQARAGPLETVWSSFPTFQTLGRKKQG